MQESQNVIQPAGSTNYLIAQMINKIKQIQIGIGTAAGQKMRRAQIGANAKLLYEELPNLRVLVSTRCYVVFIINSPPLDVYHQSRSTANILLKKRLISRTKSKKFLRIAAN